MDIKDIRQKLGLTQEQFAHKLGMSARTIRRWETGKFKPSPLAQQAIRVVFGISDNITAPHQRHQNSLQRALQALRVVWYRFCRKLWLLDARER